MLDDSRIGHCQGSENESPSDASDGLEFDAHAAQSGIDEPVANRDEDDDGQGIDVLHDVVRYPVQFHDARLRDEVVQHLVVHDPVDGEEDEDAAGDEAAFELVDEEVVPRCAVAAAVFVSEGGFCGFHVEAVRYPDPHCAEGVYDYGASRWADDVVFFAELEGRW